MLGQTGCPRLVSRAWTWSARRQQRGGLGIAALSSLSLFDVGSDWLSQVGVQGMDLECPQTTERWFGHFGLELLKLV